MAVSMDDDVPLILTLDDSGSSASAPLDELDREELPNESKSALSLPARGLSLGVAAVPAGTGGAGLGVGAARYQRVRLLPRVLSLTAPCGTAGPDGSCLCCFCRTVLWFPP